MSEEFSGEDEDREAASDGPHTPLSDIEWSSTVLIEGATGLNSSTVNGTFEVAERPDKEPPIYRRAGGIDAWLYVNHTGKWAVGDNWDKDVRKTSSMCWARSVEEAQGRLPHEVGSAWDVVDGVESRRGEYHSVGYTEQQLRVLHGEDTAAAIAKVCVYARRYAGAQVRTRTRTHADIVLPWPLVYGRQPISRRLTAAGP